ncbi:glycosyltransferase family 25 protein [Pantoea sp. JV6]|uniref:glycosyltransferase family 25 protein n=1 Tax=Pantoea sp. JV6 TaxID=2981604 RepID=UPI00221EA64F|nr:glycosyltransferase family 25 protein [Pantoea sp. JV6]MCW0976978.1 glycosyltransferase family 25 protein [Pantoea sp. JV6]
MIKVFVINLARSTERRDTMEQQLTLLNLDYEIVEAVDGSLLSFSDIAKETRPLNYAVEPGEIGCALSHISIYRKIVSENIECALIIEDDAILSDNLPLLMSELIHEPQNKACLTLLTPVSEYVARPLTYLSASFTMHTLIEGTGAYGYVVNNMAAKRLIEFLYPIWLISDRWQFLRDNGVCNVCCINPPLISHPPSLNSELYKTSTIQSGFELSAMKDVIWRKIKANCKVTVKLRSFFWTVILRNLLNTRRIRSS